MISYFNLRFYIKKIYNDKSYTKYQQNPVQTGITENNIHHNIDKLINLISISYEILYNYGFFIAPQLIIIQCFQTNMNFKPESFSEAMETLLSVLSINCDSDRQSAEKYTLRNNYENIANRLTLYVK